MDKHQSKIKMVLGAHIHEADVRAPISKSFPDLKVVQFATPSVSPIFNNNPGYTIMEIRESSNHISMMEWRYFNLYQYTLFKYKSFLTIDP